MLSELNIKNIALIENLNLQFYKGLNILSGETGAGKSIIIDSLNFVLGERADKTLIRYGTDFATVEAVFSDYQNEKIDNFLDELGFENEEILIIFRKMTVEGKNECRINGRLTTLSNLKKLTELLADIHGQHQHQSLLKVSEHLYLLDSFNQDNIFKAKSEVQKYYYDFKKLIKESKTLGNPNERQRKCDILAFQIEEIENAEVSENEENELLEKRKMIRNMERILSALNESLQLIDGYDGSILTNLKNSSNLLNSISNFDENIENYCDRLESSRFEIKDISDSLNDFKNQLDFDKNSADKIEERLDSVRNIIRKYGGSFEKMQEFLTTSKKEYNMLSNADQRAEDIKIELEKIKEVLLQKLENLSELRKLTAVSLENQIMSELCDLGMKGSKFKVDFVEFENVDEKFEKCTANGFDEVEFLISANEGEPLKPLHKIISGGEMSRFMLALKTIICNVDGINTMVFDEVDTGISGHIAQVVACKLAKIAHGRQVLAVTHMPQLASMAEHHFLIEKHSKNGKTTTNLSLMKDNMQEVARLIGGSDYSGFAIPHAKEMIEWSNNFKKEIS